MTNELNLHLEKMMEQANKTPNPTEAFKNTLREQFVAQGVLVRQPQSHPAKRQSARMFFQSHPVYAFVLSLVLVLVVCGAVYAAGKALGYIPGFGLVDQAQPVRVLSQPVSVTQDGFTLTVSKAVLSSEKTTIDYTLTGLSGEMIQVPGTCSGEQASPILRLPDGKELEFRGQASDINDPLIYRANVDFAALPAGVSEASLMIPCFSLTEVSAIPQNWKIPLRFVDADEQVTIEPVVTAVIVQNTQEPSQETTAPIVYLPGLEITMIVPVDDGYLLAGVIKTESPDGLTFDETDRFLEDTTITDAQGGNVLYGPAPDDFIPEELISPEEGVIGWTAKITGKEIAWPIQMTVNSLTAQTAPYPQAQFQFDAGSELPLNEPLALNLDVPFGPKTIHVVSVARVEKGFGSLGYEFTFAYDPSVDFSLAIPGHMAMGGGGSGPDAMGNFTRFLGYRDDFPTGLITVNINGSGIVQSPGPWQITFDAPTP